MKIFRTLVLSTVLTAATATVSFAQSGHSHKALHGGIVQEADGYHIEMVKAENTISFYLLDAKEKTINNKGVTGTTVFEFINKTKTTATLRKGDKNALVLDTPKANVFTFCTVTVLVKGKTITSKFQNDAISLEDIQHGHKH